jgi:hypothetical protein
MVNRYTNFTPYTFDLDKPNIPALSSVLAVLQKRHDANKLLADQLKNTLIDALPQDRARANELQEKYAKQIDNTVAAYKGDYSKATNALYEVQSAMKRDFGKGGEASAIQSNYDSYLGWNERQQKRLEKKEILAEDYDVARNYFLQGFQGTGQKNEYGTYNDISNGLEEIAEYVNPNDIIQIVKPTVGPNSYKKTRTVFKNGLQTEVTESHKQVSAERLTAAFEQGLNGNQKLTGYLEQKLRFNGQDPAAVGTYLSAYAAARGKELATDEVEDLQKSERDPLSLAKYNQDRQDARLKEDFTPRYNFLSTVENVTPYKPLDQDAMFKDVNYRPNNTALSGSSYGNLFNYQIEESSSERYKRQQNLSKVLADPELVRERGIMPQLAQAFIQDHIAGLHKDPSQAKAIYDTKYGKDATWTKNFDAGVINDYNTDIKNHQRAEPIALTIPYDNGGKELMTSAYSALVQSPKSVQVYELGTGNQMTAEAAGIEGSDLLMNKTSSSNGTEVSQDVKYIVPQPFVPRGGLTIPKNGKQYVIVDQDQERYTQNKAMGESYQDIYTRGKTTGRQFQIGDGVSAAPNLNIENSRERSGKDLQLTYFLYRNGVQDTQFNKETGKQEPIQYDLPVSELINNIPSYKNGIYKKLK